MEISLRPAISKSPSLQRGSVYMLGHAFNPQPVNWQHCLSFHFILAQSFVVSLNEELKVFSDLSWPWAQPYAWLSTPPGMCRNLSKPYIWTPQFLDFPFSFLGSLLLVPICLSTARGSCGHKQLSLVVFTNCPYFPIGQALREVK